MPLRKEVSERLRGGLFLSSMMGHTDWGFCARRAPGCAMVQMGAFVVCEEPRGGNVYWQLPDEERLSGMFREQFSSFRAAVGDEAPLVCANVFPCDDEDLLVSARAFDAADGDVYELNAHGGIGGDEERGTGAMLFTSRHRDKLFRWVELLVEMLPCVVVKGRRGVVSAEEYIDCVRRFERMGVFAFHMNLRVPERGVADMDLLRRLREATDIMLLASGYVKGIEDVRAMFDAGADAVGIGEAALADPGVFSSLRRRMVM